MQFAEDQNTFWSQLKVSKCLSSFPSLLKNFPQDNQKVRLSVSGFLCAFEIPIPGSPTSASSPVQTGERENCFSAYFCTEKRSTKLDLK